MGRRFVFQHNYKSSFGIFHKDDVVEFTKDEAEFLSRDSPGVIKPEKGKKAAEGPTGPTGPEGEDTSGATGPTGEGPTGGEGS